MTQGDLFDSARQARDEAIERVTRPNYLLKAITCIGGMSGEVTGEDVRLAVEAKIGQPHHHNAWGGIINSAVRSGVLTKTGRYRQMRTTKSHARETKTYWVTGRPSAPDSDQPTSSR